MIKPIYPCLWFDGNAKEAASFYSSAFEKAKVIADTPMVVIFELFGKKFMCLNGGPKYKINPSISFFVSYDSVNEIDNLWKHLSDGGKVMMPLNSYPWSERYGWCQDKFGVNWQLMLRKTGDENIFPALMFTQSNSGKAEQAINFYVSVFKDSVIRGISHYEKGEPDTEGYIKHAQFTLNNQLFAAMDSSGPHSFTFNEALSFVVECDTQEEIDYYWNKLTEGGQESMCGWLKDKFGVSWQIIPSILGSLMNDPEKAPGVIQAFLQMKKFDIEKLMQA